LCVSHTSPHLTGVRDPKGGEMGNKGDAAVERGGGASRLGGGGGGGSSSILHVELYVIYDNIIR